MEGSLNRIFAAVVLVFVLPSILIGLMQPSTPSDAQVQSITFETTPETEPEEKMISVLTGSGVLQMELEDYICGVVLREMPAEFDLEALKAQAVVARTYTLRADEKRSKHADAAVCTEASCCQGYWDVADYLLEGGTEAALLKVQEAVNATKGVVITYDRQLIDATYFSCSGGMTEDAVAVWGADVPYLQSTQSPGEEGAVHFEDSVSFSAEAFCEQLGLPKTQTVSVKVLSYTEGGGVASLQICGRQFSGTEVRSLLGLRSTAFTMEASAGSVTVTTKGYGHRVGMSQYGAEAMALSGSTYEEILHHYYRDVELKIH